MMGKSQTTAPDQAILIALKHHQAGRLPQAEAIYKKVLQTEPNHPDALHLLGMTAYQTGNLHTAIKLVTKAVHINAANPLYYNNLGEIYRVQRSYNHALRCYRQALSLKPDYSEAYNNMGNALQEQGKYSEALACYRKALSHKPDYAEAYNNLGNALQEQVRYDEALQCYQKGLSLKPDYAEAHNNLGNVLHELGRHNEALQSYQKALSLKPDYAEAYNNLGMVFHEQGELDKAHNAYTEALSLKNDFYIAHNNLGNIYYEQGQLGKALTCYRKAVSLKPDYAEAHNNIGNIFQEEGNQAEARACYKKALSLKPDYADAYNNLGNILYEQGKQTDALKCYQKALTIKPDYTAAKWAFTLAHIPSFYGPDVNPEAWRSRFSRKLAELDDWFDANRTKSGHHSVGVRQPFYLAYHEECNRDLLARYGGICARLMDAWWHKQGYSSPEIKPNGVIRVGIISAHIRAHSVWDAIIKGWLQHLDRDSFELYIFHLGSEQDEETAWAQAQSSFFIQGGKSLNQWIEIILNKKIHALIYPEIGMDPMTLKLASLRLSPVQAAVWGHPETTGLPTMDYYLSAEGFEPTDADTNYTEQLVCLPHFGCCYHYPGVTASTPDLADLAIDSESPILVCPGSPFKYMPQYDSVFVEIARELGRCQFVFFTHRLQNLSAKLHQRLESVFTRAGMDFNDYGVFLPWQESSEFHGLMRKADVFLDTIGFSGFNTAMQAMGCDLPVVSLEGRFMRGRLASGILRRMGLTELIADSKEAYVNLVVRLINDDEYRGNIKQRIIDVRHVLYDDIAPIRALEEFLTNVSRVVTEK